MMLPYIVTLEHGKSGAIESIGDEKSMNLLSEMIDYGKDGIVIIGGVKACDKVN